MPPIKSGHAGDLAEIDKLAQAASVLYVLPEERDGGAYLVGHSSTITLVNPEGQVHAIYTSPLEAARVAADFGAIVEHHRAKRR